MHRIHIEPLTAESFMPFGTFASLVSPRGPRIGEAPIEFFRDTLQHSLSIATAVSFSTCRVQPRPLIVDVLEYHSYTGEAMLALDNDMIVQTGPATRLDDPVPVDDLRAFNVPRGTMVTLRPGVWHHAPFTPNKSPLHVLVSLPERAYANDCVVVELTRSQRVLIESRGIGPAESANRRPRKRKT
jgi:ureidoglycolate lyase